MKKQPKRQPPQHLATGHWYGACGAYTDQLVYDPDLTTCRRCREALADEMVAKSKEALSAARGLSGNDYLLRLLVAEYEAKLRGPKRTAPQDPKWAAEQKRREARAYELVRRAAEELGAK